MTILNKNNLILQHLKKYFIYSQGNTWKEGNKKIKRFLASAKEHKYLKLQTS